MARQQRAASGTPASTVGPTGTAAAVAPGADVDDDDVILRLRGVTKSYGAVQVVHGIDLDIRKGEVLTLLGPSGCGKTTTLRMCIGLERASGGTIAHRDRVLDDGAGKVVPIHRRNMGMVFQSYAIWPHMTVAKNVGYPLEVQGAKKAHVRSAVARILDLVGMGAFADRPATKLSGGQQQRVALARALVFEPELLLLDEPLSNLDAKLRGEMRTEIKRLQRRLGISIIFVTHDQLEALAVSDRIAVLKDGRIEQVGPPTQLYEHPRTTFVRDFLGESLKLVGTVVASADDSVTVSVPLEEVRFVGRPAPVLVPRTGDSCELSIRPDEIRASRPGGDRGRNALRGTIAALLYMGERLEASVDLESGTTVRAPLSKNERWQEGDEVELHLPEDKLVVWPVEPTADPESMLEDRTLA